jgi:predicted deacylase
MKPEEFDPNGFGRDEKSKTELQLDSSITLQVLLGRGRLKGPTLVVSAGVHGDEYEGVRAIFETFADLSTPEMSGDLLAVPVVNPPAFWNGTRTSPLDGLNLARVFPGAADGSPSERIAWHFAHSILARADFYLDLHSGGIRLRMPSMVGYCSSDPRGIAAAEIFGASVIWGHPSIEPGRTISFADRHGIPWLYTEARGAGRIQADDLQMMKCGIRNLMQHLGILPGKASAPAALVRLYGNGNTDVGLTSTQPGFLLKEIEVMEPVRAGQIIGRLVNIYGEILEEYVAPIAGVVGLVREFPVVEAGDSLFLIAEVG